MFQVFLLPDRSHKSKRRTKTVGTTCEPRWGQTFLYSGLRRCDLNGRLLEVCPCLPFPMLSSRVSLNSTIHCYRSHCGIMCDTGLTTSSARWSSIWPTTYSTTRPSGISCSRIRTSPTSYVLPGTRTRLRFNSFRFIYDLFWVHFVRFISCRFDSLRVAFVPN